MTDAVVVPFADEESQAKKGGTKGFFKSKMSAGDEIEQAQKNQLMQSQVQQVVPINNDQQLAISRSRKTHLKELGRNPTGLHCPHCGRQTITTIRDIVGVGTILGVIVMTILFFPLFWVPFCIPSCRRTHHYCGHTQCRQKVGETRVCA